MLIVRVPSDSVAVEARAHRTVSLIAECGAVKIEYLARIRAKSWVVWLQQAPALTTIWGSSASRIQVDTTSGRLCAHRSKIHSPVESVTQRCYNTRASPWEVQIKRRSGGAHRVSEWWFMPSNKHQIHDVKTFRRGT